MNIRQVRIKSNNITKIFAFYYVKLLILYYYLSKLMLNKDDQIFLEQYISYFKLISESTGDLLGGVLSLDYKILYKSAFSKHIGASDNEVMEHLKKPEIIALQAKAIEKRILVKYLLMGQLENGKSSFLILSYAPIINPNTNNIVALYCGNKVVETLNIWFILSKCYTKGIATMDEFEYQIKLTAREKQVVFLFLLNLDSNTIAEIISKIENKKISKNAIDQVFTAQLIPKFSVFGRKALYEKLTELGYYRFVPNNVLQKGFCIEITDYTILDQND